MKIKKIIIKIEIKTIYIYFAFFNNNFFFIYLFFVFRLFIINFRFLNLFKKKLLS